MHLSSHLFLVGPSCARFLSIGIFLICATALVGVLHIMIILLSNLAYSNSFLQGLKFIGITVKILLTTTPDPHQLSNSHINSSFSYVSLHTLLSLPIISLIC